MKKTNKLMLLVVVLLVSVLALTACNGFTPFTVKFETNGGSDVADLEVKSLEDFKLPAEPTKEGFTFAGWYIDSALTTKFDIEAAKAVDGVVTVYAKWTENEVPTYTITFVTNVDGVEVAGSSVESGETFTCPTAPEATGLTFAGWYTKANGEGESFDFEAGATADVTVYAKWVFVVTLEHNNFSYAVDTFNATVVDGEATVTIADADLDSIVYYNYEKAGFYTVNADGEKVDFILGTTKITADTTIFIKWIIPEEVTLSFVTGIDGVIVEPVKADYNAKFEEPTAPESTGLKFAGWYTEPNGEGERFGFGEWAKHDLTVYAKWVYTATLDYNNGTDGSYPLWSTAVEAVGDEATVGIYSNYLNGVTKEGCYIDGFYTLDEDGNKVEFKSELTTITSEVTIYIVWSEYITLSFNTGIEGVTVAPVVAEYNAKFEEPTAPEVAGLTFAGWYTEANGEGEHFGFGDWAKEDLTVYAKWVYTATLQYHNGTGDTLEIFSTVVTAAGQNATVSIYNIFLAGVENEGYEIAGLYTEGYNGAEIAFISGETVITGDVTIWVKWVSETKVTLSFDTGIEGVTVAPVVAAYNQKFERPANPTAEGLTFAGWYTEANGEGEYFGFGEWAKKDLTVYAKWVYTATLVYNNGTDDSYPLWSSAVEAAGDDATVAIYNIYLGGITNGDLSIVSFYTLDGNNEVEFLSEDTVITGDVTIYIKWVKALTLTVDDNGTLTKVVVGEGVKDVVIPSLYNGIEITAIGAMAISMQNGIETLTIPATVKTVAGNGIFYNASLKTIIFEGNGLKTLDANAFFNNALVETIYLPAGIETIADKAYNMMPSTVMTYWGESFADAQTFDIENAFGIGAKIAYGATSINNYVVAFTANTSTTVVDHYEAVPMGKTVAYYAHCTDGHYQTKVATWYTDKACTTKFDFETRITADIALYAVFTDTDYTRVFTPTQLKDAFAAGGKIQLINNFTADLVVASGKTVVLDLNGYTITAETDHAITNNGNLTVDGKEIATGETVNFINSVEAYTSKTLGDQVRENDGRYTAKATISGTTINVTLTITAELLADNKLVSFGIYLFDGETKLVEGDVQTDNVAYDPAPQWGGAMLNWYNTNNATKTYTLSYMGVEYTVVVNVVNEIA